MKAVNLIPADQRKDTESVGGRSQGAAFGVLALLGGMALLALLYGVAHHQVSTRTSEAQQLQQQAQQTQAEASRLAPYTSFVSLREQRAQAISQLVNSRFNWAQAYHELARVLPANASLNTVSGTIATGPAAGSATAAAPSAASSSPSAGTTSASTTAASSSTSGSSSVKSATPPGSAPTFTIAGCATTQAEVARTLERLRLVEGVSEVTLQSSDTSGSSGSTGGCPTGDPAFSVLVTFKALPANTAKVPPLTSTGTTPVAATESGVSR
jgi:Tfp pilus assembly protein PilN